MTVPLSVDHIRALLLLHRLGDADALQTLLPLMEQTDYSQDIRANICLAAAHAALKDSNNTLAQSLARQALQFDVRESLLIRIYHLVAQVNFAAGHTHAAHGFAMAATLLTSRPQRSLEILLAMFTVSPKLRGYVDNAIRALQLQNTSVAADHIMSAARTARQSGSLSEAVVLWHMVGTLRRQLGDNVEAAKCMQLGHVARQYLWTQISLAAVKQDPVTASDAENAEAAEYLFAQVRRQLNVGNLARAFDLAVAAAFTGATAVIRINEPLWHASAVACGISLPPSESPVIGSGPAPNDPEECTILFNELFSSVTPSVWMLETLLQLASQALPLLPLRVVFTPRKQLYFAAQLSNDSLEFTRDLFTRTVATWRHVIFTKPGPDALARVAIPSNAQWNLPFSCAQAVVQTIERYGSTVGQHLTLASDGVCAVEVAGKFPMLIIHNVNTSAISLWAPLCFLPGSSVYRMRVYRAALYGLPHYFVPVYSAQNDLLALTCVIDVPPSTGGSAHHELQVVAREFMQVALLWQRLLLALATDAILKTQPLQQRSRRFRMGRDAIAILRGDCLEYVETATAQPKRKSISLQEVTSVECENNTFTLFTAGREYTFQVGSEAEANDWAKDIRTLSRTLNLNLDEALNDS
eukprot:TRINITY_DN2843_c0_g1_i2.p1 TRINITY_DN2843_c0_g1~~TRINITY_DN2843_c0_g1_i2.p1  ORF type:complete len:743 (+),score=202.88 TRINITY_DN2843_c0_g1_i2:314-2230(+)